MGTLNGFGDVDTGLEERVELAVGVEELVERVDEEDAIAAGSRDANSETRQICNREFRGLFATSQLGELSCKCLDDFSDGVLVNNGIDLSVKSGW